MTPSKHTPGPWVVKGRLVEAPFRLDLGVAQAIAGMTAGSRGASQITVPEAEANARLIAAAPDMLEALKLAKGWLELWASAERELAIINETISKAEGRALPLNAEGGDK